jgi:preprotein translocase subunit SecG
MQEVLLVIHLIVAVAIIAVVLLQPSESGGFMGNSGSMSNLMAPRRTADALTRLTTILAGCFFCTSLLLAITATSRPQAQGLLDMARDTPAAIEKSAEDEETLSEKPEAPETVPTPKAPLAE